MKTGWLAALGYLLFVGCANSPPSGTSESAITGTTTLVALGSSDGTEPAVYAEISGTRVVWNVFDFANDFNVWFLDLASTAPARALTSNSEGSESGGVGSFLGDIDGTNVVWYDYQPPFNEGGTIVVDDTTTSTAVTVASGGEIYQVDQPAIQGRYVVFRQTNVSLPVIQMDIEGFDNLLGVPFALTNDGSAQNPRVSGDLVVYEDYSSGNADIFGYHISTAGPSFPIATGPTSQTQPDVDGTRVVWVDHNGYDQIMLWDSVSGTTRQLTTAASDKYKPRISGDRVVWTDDRSGGFDAYTYDIAENTESLLASGGFYPDIDGARVVYFSFAAVYAGVYVFTFSPETLVEQLQALAAAVQGLGNSLMAKLNAALQDVQSGDDAAACSELDAFLHELAAQTGKKITAAQAAEMQDTVCQTTSQIGCPCN